MPVDQGAKADGLVADGSRCLKGQGHLSFDILSISGCQFGDTFEFQFGIPQEIADVTYRCAIKHTHSHTHRHTWNVLFFLHTHLLTILNSH